MYVLNATAFYLLLVLFSASVEFSFWALVGALVVDCSTKIGGDSHE